ncbi:hypothetical protein WA026_021933 [Henosepilachna vigintioctopunctata]|uniref:Lipid-binding serum glycoprotein N-terminal domain-containing protein n=1 Tax=Henosepilachna vigintioctopunctata TaxID=420089 RepID=A0AAW1VII5_9CUCU
MKSLYIVLSALLGFACGSALKLPNLGRPCYPSDIDCCGNKLKTLGGLLLKGLNNPLITRLDVSFDYGCCNMEVIAQDISIVDFADVFLKQFEINLEQGTAELDVEAKQLNISTTYDITGKCVDLPVSAGGGTILQLKNTQLKLIVEFAIRRGRLLIVSVKIQPIIAGIDFVLRNPTNDKLQKLLNRSPLDKVQSIFQPVFQKLICNVENILLQLLEQNLNGLNIALLLLL